MDWPINDESLSDTSELCPVCGEEMVIEDNGIYCELCGYKVPSLYLDEELVQSVSSHVYFPSQFFPYPEYRDHQEELINDIFTCLGNGGHLIVNAPNGFGKTITCLSAVLPIALNNNKKIIYCNRTHTQTDQIIREMQKIRNSCGKRIVVIALKGKVNLCSLRLIEGEELDAKSLNKVCQDLRENDACGYYGAMKGSKDNGLLDSICEEMVQSTDILDEDYIIETAHSMHYCPYFLTLELVKYADVISCNYLWVFHPGISRIFVKFSHTDYSDMIVVIDEAHNLPNVAKDFLSNSLNEKDVSAALTEVDLLQNAIRIAQEDATIGPNILALSKEDGIIIKQFVTFLSYYFAKLKKEIEAKVTRNKGKSLYEEEMIEEKVDTDRIIDTIRRETGWINGNIIDLFDRLELIDPEIVKLRVRRGYKEIQSHLGDIGHFFKNLNLVKDDQAYCAYSTWTDKEHLSKLEIDCFDPYYITIGVFSRVFASLSLSGTIDAEIFELQCLREQDPDYREVPSSFGHEQVRALYASTVTSLAKKRTEAMFRSFADLILDVVKVVPRNVGIFCVSKKFLAGILKTDIEQRLKLLQRAIFVEDPFMTAPENQEMIDEFKKNGDDGRDSVLFGVMGGRNSEGEDFPGDEMNAVILCGLPLLPIKFLILEEISYYDHLYPGRGNEIAYDYPAFQKVNQTAGRPARSMDDRSIIILGDSRYFSRRNKLSAWIRNNSILQQMGNEKIIEQIHDFFKDYSI